MKDIFTGLDLSEEVTTELRARIQKEIDAQKSGVKNDPDFIRSIRQEEAGKFFKSQEKIYKKVFPELDLNEIDGDGMSRMEAIAKAGMATVEQSKDATNQELQQKYLDAVAEYNKYKDEVVPGMLTKKDSEYQEVFIHDGLFKDCVDIDSTIKPEFRPAIVDSYLHKNKMKKTWDSESKTYDILTHDNLKPTKDGKPLLKTDILTMAIEEAGGLTKSNGTNTGGGEPSPRKTHGKLSANAQQMLDSFNNAG